MLRFEGEYPYAHSGTLCAVVQHRVSGSILCPRITEKSCRPRASVHAFLEPKAEFGRNRICVFQRGHAKAFPIVEPPDDERKRVRFRSLHSLLASRHVLAPRWRLPWHEFGDGGRDASKNLLCIHPLELAELQSWGLMTIIVSAYQRPIIRELIAVEIRGDFTNYGFARGLVFFHAGLLSDVPRTTEPKKQLPQFRTGS
jgi:hypothetical protein